MTTFGTAAFELLVANAKATRLPGATAWRKAKLSARRVADTARTLSLDAAQVQTLRLAMGRSGVRTRTYRVEGKGHKHERNRIARLELIETRLKEIPKIEQQHKQQVERDKIKASKAHKGINLVYTPKLVAASRAAASLVKQRVAPPLPVLSPALVRVAQGKHLTALPPHLQAELDRLRAARDAKAAALAAKAAAIAVGKQ